MKQKNLNIILSIVIILFLFFIFGLGFYLYKQTENEIVNILGGQQILISKQIQKTVESYFQSRAQGLKVLSSFESIVKRIPDKIRDDVNSYYQYLKSHYITAISVFDEKGKIIYSTSEEAIGKDYSSYDFWKKLERSSKDSLFYVPIVEPDSLINFLYKKPFSLVISPVYVNGRFFGAVAYTIQVDSLMGLLVKSFEPEVKFMDTWIMSGDKILVFHSSHPEMVLRRAQFNESKCYNCHISFGYVDTMLVKESGMIRYKLKNHPEKLAGFSRFKIGEENFVFVVTVPFDEILKIARANWEIVYLLLGLIVLILVICGFLFLRNIREMIRAEERERQREEQEKIQKLYTLLFQNSNDGIYILDLENKKFVEVNKRFQEMFGYTLEELSNVNFINLVAPESRALIEERRQKIANGVPVPQRYTFTALTKEGRKIEIEESVSYVQLGKKMYVLGVCRDISEILRQRELYQNLFDNLPVGVVIHQDGKIVKCNKVAVQSCGAKSEDDLIGKPVLNFVHPDYVEVVIERIRKMIEYGEEVPPIEEKLICLDGRVIDAEVRASRIMWEGRPAVQVVILDITETKRLHRELIQKYSDEQKLKLRFETILRNISDGVLYQNEQGVIEFVNEEFCRIMGYRSPSELIGKTFDEFLERFKELIEDLKEIDKIKNLIREKEFVKYDELKFKDGRIIERTEIPIFDLSGKYIGHLFLARDITERKQKEKQILELQKFEVLGHLSSGIAHDFNNVLGIIGGVLEIIKIKTSDENIVGYLDSALSAVQRGAEITKRLLQFSKKKIEDFKPISVKNLVLDCVKILEHTIPKNIQIKMDITTDSVIYGSYGDLQQVILNLALNAKDAMPFGGDLTITVNSIDKSFIEKKFGKVVSDSYVMIAVSDTGVGISDELKEKIFEPFFTTKEPGKGTGLGLAIVKNIISIHGGYVDFESVVGRGTTFYVYLPIQFKEGEEIKTHRGEEKMQKIGQGYKALIIEDEESLRIIMRDYLEILGFNVIEATDGVEGLKKFEENKDIKIVFADYGLPKIMGDELIRRISQISKDVKSVLVTGFVDVGDEVKKSLPSGTKFLRKPYNLAQIEEIVKEFLRV
ncbi:MAG: PAS domain S-box protein [Candidatus Kryptonium sp.]